MSENVKCPACGKQAQWFGCAGCGDDIGTVSCGCGLTLPGVALGELLSSGRPVDPPSQRGGIVSEEERHETD